MSNQEPEFFAANDGAEEFNSKAEKLPTSVEAVPLSNLHRELCRLSDDALSLHDRDGLCLASTQALWRLIGRQASALHKIHLKDFSMDIDPNLAECVLQQGRQGKSGGAEIFHIFVPGQGSLRLAVSGSPSSLGLDELIEVKWSLVQTRTESEAESEFEGKRSLEDLATSEAVAQLSGDRPNDDKTALENLIATIVLDLDSHLGKVGQWISDIASNARIEPKLEREFEAVEAAASRCNRKVAQLLALSVIEKDGTRRTAAFKSVLRQILDDFQLQHPSLPVSCVTPTRDFAVALCPSTLKDVLARCFDCLAKHMHGDQTITVRHFKSECGQRVTIGFDREIKSFVQRGKIGYKPNQRLTIASCLDIRIAAYLLQREGGALAIEAGSRFVLTLPD